MMINIWDLLLNQSGGGSIDMSRGFSGFGNLPPLDWMPNPGAEHGVDVRGQFSWNAPDPYTYFRWYESLQFARAREEDRRLLLGDSAKTSRMLLAGKFSEIQLDTGPERKVVNGVEYEFVDIAGFKCWLEVNLLAPRSHGGQPTAPPKPPQSTPDWLEQFAAPYPLGPASPTPPPTSPTPPPTSYLADAFFGVTFPPNSDTPAATPLIGSPIREWASPRHSTPSPVSDYGRKGGYSIVPPPPIRGGPQPSSAPTTVPDWTTQTEWTFPESASGPFQPVTSIDTGNRPLNFLLNKVLVPWRNALAFYGNTPFEMLSETDHALKHSAVQMEYQAAQDMMPLAPAMGLAMEVGPAMAYARSWISTSQRVRASVGAGGRALQTLGPELESALPSASSSTEASALFEGRPTFGNLGGPQEGKLAGVLQQEGRIYYLEGSTTPLTGKYDFVIKDGQILVGEGHGFLAGGERVTWAGELHFANDGSGVLESFSNVSGHIRPYRGFVGNVSPHLIGVPFVPPRYFPIQSGLPQLPVYQPVF